MYSPVINSSIYPLTQWSWKNQKIGFGNLETFVLKAFENFQKPTFLTASSFMKTAVSLMFLKYP
jgi:hypothetical protein